MNVADANGKTVLNVAEEQSRPEIVQLLRNKGARLSPSRSHHAFPWLMLLLSPQAYSSVGQVIPLCATNDCTQAIASFAPSTRSWPVTPAAGSSIDTSGRDQLIDLIAIVRQLPNRVAKLHSVERN